MTENSARNRTLKDRFFGPRTQASLFHYIREEQDESIWKGMDWNFIAHPVRTAHDAWSRPRSKPSLFHYVEEEQREPFSWRELFHDLFTGFRNPLFIPSVFSDPVELMVEKARGRTRNLEARSASVLVHIFVFGIAFFIVSHHGAPDPLLDSNAVFLDNSGKIPIFIPLEPVAEVKKVSQIPGGGGGGGGDDSMPPQSGRIPDPVSADMIVPDPQNPQPMIPKEDRLAHVIVELPVSIPLDLSLDIGDPTQPPNLFSSFGPGDGGGLGTGHGRGDGSGTGPGGGSGKNGGYGDGDNGWIGNGKGKGPYYLGDNVQQPVLLKQVKPPYTDEARIARAQGVVLLEAVVRKNGTVGDFNVVRGLGYGLDAVAVQTVGSKWRFQPASCNGENIDYPVQIEVTFSMY